MAKKCHFLVIFRQNRASRKPYKAPENLGSRDTALFTILRYRGSSKLTEAFCLWLRGKIGLKTSKTGIFGAIFRVLGSNLCIFLFFTVILSRNHIYIKLLRGNRGSVRPIYYFWSVRQKWTKHKPYGINFGTKQAFSCGKMRHIWCSAPYMAHTYKRHIGYAPPLLLRRGFCGFMRSKFILTYKKTSITLYIAPSRRGRHSGDNSRSIGDY